MSLLMNSNESPLGLCPPLMEKKDGNEAYVFDHSKLQSQANIPREFVWPEGDLNHIQVEELNEPLVDLEGFLRGDERATAEAAKFIRKACLEHGFFQVTNHGIDASLVQAAEDEIDSIFKLPLEKKLSVLKKPTSLWGYSGAHATRFSSKLPWKETFSFFYHENDSNPVVLDYFKSVLGEEFEGTGLVYQRYCEEMKKLSGVIFELLGISLGLDRWHYKKLFEDSYSIMRCNSYPPCNNSSLTFGTGPHTDPNSITILHQDQVAGLQVFTRNKWHLIQPRKDALVINLGDTFVALSNGIYKSCMHRAVVNRDIERKSLVFFVSPNMDKVVRPPQDLICREVPRKYPDFTWSDLFKFTITHYRPDGKTLEHFFRWLAASKPSDF